MRSHYEEKLLQLQIKIKETEMERDKVLNAMGMYQNDIQVNAGLIVANVHSRSAKFTSSLRQQAPSLVASLYSCVILTLAPFSTTFVNVFLTWFTPLFWLPVVAHNACCCLFLASKNQSQAEVEEAKKIREDFEKKLNNLQAELKQMQDAKRRHAQLVKEQEKQEKVIREYRQQLEELKKTKAELMRKIREEG